MEANVALQGYIYSPLSFLNRRHEGLGVEFMNGLHQDLKSGALSLVEDEAGGTKIYYRALPWDSEYFGIPTYRIDFMQSTLGKKEAVENYHGLLRKLDVMLAKKHGKYYIFSEIPSEALTSMQALGLASWRLIETRLTYYCDKIQAYQYPKRFATAEASFDDIESLSSTAKACRNDYDRFHADFYYCDEDADRFLGTFVENSIRGYADIVMIPHGTGGAPDAFLTANLMPAGYCGESGSIGKMILSAVGNSRRGWYVKLISEMTYKFKELGVDMAFMTTQSTNKAVIRTWEKLGYSYGKSTHIFANLTTGIR